MSSDISVSSELSSNAGVLKCSEKIKNKRLSVREPKDVILQRPILMI